LHEFIPNCRSIQVKDALLLAVLYIGVGLIIARIAWIFYRDLVKACLIAFFLLAYQFFFGSIQDFLKTLFPNQFFSQYRFLLPFSLIIFSAFVIWLKKRKRSLLMITSYLNALLIILILVDAGRFVIKKNKNRENAAMNLTDKFISCDGCAKPDIYLILLDQYPGGIALKEVFDFDNSAFEDELNRRGFHITQKSSSNYNLTPFSMASILNMDYLSSEMGGKNHLNVSYSYDIVRNNQALKFLTAQGYKFYNYSVFDFPGQPAHQYGSFFPYGTKLITMQTFTGRLINDIRADILTGKLKFKGLQKKIAYEHLQFNDEIYELTKDVSNEKKSIPKFVYSHFIMPHWPYYFDSKGNPMPEEKLSGFRKTNAHDFIEYLQYCNKKILELTDHLLNNSPSPPIIILLSDHGFRHPEKHVDRKYDFMNLNSIYLPDKNYSSFPDSMTNVNFFRILFNSNFGQRLPLLKDSTIDLWN
jgi:hypothetical protein